MKTAWRRLNGLSAPALVILIAGILSVFTVKLFLLEQVPMVSLPGAAMTLGHFGAAMLALGVAFLPCGLAREISRRRSSHEARQAAGWLTASGALMGGAMYFGVILILFEPNADASQWVQTIDVLSELAVTVIGTAGVVAAIIGFVLTWSCASEEA